MNSKSEFTEMKNGSNEKFELFFEWTAFKELCFEKDVCCEKKANKEILKGKLRNHPPY